MGEISPPLSIEIAGSRDLPEIILLDDAGDRLTIDEINAALVEREALREEVEELRAAVAEDDDAQAYLDRVDDADRARARAEKAERDLDEAVSLLRKHLAVADRKSNRECPAAVTQGIREFLSRFDEAPDA